MKNYQVTYPLKGYKNDAREPRGLAPWLVRLMGRLKPIH